MFNALNTKLLIVIAALLASIVAYLAYEKHQRDVVEKKAEQRFEQMRKQGQQTQPQKWGDSLKKK
ncbi:MAG: hypothetical protein JO108_25630 [Acidobacteriaceae bacterium]|jgi:uncharacterized membrane protein YdjX (TVP38/TMEM64 family)|nr:hypothetical protein [Acidobacteriaceae bacterium]